MDEEKTKAWVRETERFFAAMECSQPTTKRPFLSITVKGQRTEFELWWETWANADAGYIKEVMGRFIEDNSGVSLASLKHGYEMCAKCAGELLLERGK